MKRKSPLKGLLSFTFIMLLCFIFGTRSFARENNLPKRMAITIDDLPVADSNGYTPEEQIVIMKSVMAALSKHRAQATGFVIGNQIQPFHRELLTEWVKDGHSIGNHSFSHVDPHKEPISKYLSDIDKGQDAIREWANAKFYRFPYLHQGRTESDHSGIRKYLDRHAYRIAHVTIDNDDWKFDSAYKAEVRVSNLKKAHAIAHDYLEYMLDQLHHFEVRAQEVAGRPINHVLLLHMNKINADYLNGLLSLYEKEGYRFISLSEALNDPIYSELDHFRGENGISWLDRIMDTVKAN